MNATAQDSCTFFGVELSGRARLSMGVAVASFAAGLLVMLLVGWSYQSDMKLKDRELETLRGAHKTEITSMKRAHTLELKRHERNFESLTGIDKKLDARRDR